MQSWPGLDLPHQNKIKTTVHHCNHEICYIFHMVDYHLCSSHCFIFNYEICFIFQIWYLMRLKVLFLMASPELAPTGHNQPIYFYGLTAPCADKTERWFENFRKTAITGNNCNLNFWSPSVQLKIFKGMKFHLAISQEQCHSAANRCKFFCCAALRARTKLQQPHYGGKDTRSVGEYKMKEFLDMYLQVATHSSFDGPG